MLNKIADQREALESIKKKVKKALLYPIVVCVIAAGVTGILLTFDFCRPGILSHVYKLR
ncbi:PulF, Type II secretory pathway, component PulF [Francisella orientalis str. Toba 04]|nr:PulF, Type II secretory pathway, component PulF [Francisella orientalis str. Toba 04]